MYDSPFNVDYSSVIGSVAKNLGQKIDDAVLIELRNIKLNIDKDKLISALNQDMSRYEQAYKEGFKAGRESIRWRYRGTWRKLDKK